MSTFRYGAYTTVPNGTAVPTSNDGLDLTTVAGRDLQEWTLKVKVVASGAFSANIFCWRKDTANDWGTFGPASGDVNMGTAFTASGAGTYVFEVSGSFLGLPTRLYFQASNLTNITTLTTQISPIVKD